MKNIGMRNIGMIIIVFIFLVGCNAESKKLSSKTNISFPLIKADSEWVKMLTEKQFDVTRKSCTEAPFTGEYWDNHEKGQYNCVCCNAPLFSSKTKYESGSGWPSFWQPLTKKNITESFDSSAGMDRTEIICTSCGAHLGHLFDDGPQPTGLRYCINSASLKFIKE